MVDQVTPNRNPFFAGPTQGQPAQQTPVQPQPAVQPQPTVQQPVQPSQPIAIGPSFFEQNKVALMIVGAVIVFLIVIGIILYFGLGALIGEASTKF
ncbi:MAG: hypothetical protein ABIJ18_02320 [archaeon]